MFVPSKIIRLETLSTSTPETPLNNIVGSWTSTIVKPMPAGFLWVALLTRMIRANQRQFWAV